MTVSRRMIVVVEAVGAVGNGGGAPFSTNPQPARRGGTNTMLRGAYLLQCWGRPNGDLRALYRLSSPGW